jgi:hypothetical protein
MAHDEAPVDCHRDLSPVLAGRASRLPQAYELSF